VGHRIGAPVRSLPGPGAVISWGAAMAVCLGLMVADLVARAWRLVWLVRGVGQRLSFRDAFLVNVLGDGAAAVTPGRVGGEPARLAAMHRAGVPFEAGIVTISYEVLAAWPLIAAFAATLAWCWAPAWLGTVGPAFIDALREAWPWLAGVVVVSLAVAFWARRSGLALLRRLRTPAVRVSHYWRRMPLGPLLASGPMTLINLVARTAVLPVLAMTLPDPPAIGPMVVGSFGLLYSQLVLPTPAGTGGVELGFLAGAAGQFGGRGVVLLLAWRFWTTGFGLLLAAWVLAREYGWSGVRRLGAVLQQGGRSAPARKG